MIIYIHFMILLFDVLLSSKFSFCFITSLYNAIPLSFDFLLDWTAFIELQLIFFMPYWLFLNNFWSFICLLFFIINLLIIYFNFIIYASQMFRLSFDDFYIYFKFSFLHSPSTYLLVFNSTVLFHDQFFNLYW